MKKDNLTGMDHDIHQRQLAIKKLQDQQRKEPQQIQKSSIGIEYIISLGLLVIEQDKEYLSPQSVRDSDFLSTADRVKEMSKESYVVNDQYEQTTSEICQWAKNYFRPDGNEYERKCVNLFSFETVVEKDIGTIISTIPIYQKCSEMDHCKDSEFIGKIGKKTETLFLKLMEYQETERTLPGNGRLKCRDQDGNFFLFYIKNQKVTEHQLEVGDCFSLEAKVKDHVESPYDRDLSGNMIHQTQLNYVKVVKNYGKPK